MKKPLIVIIAILVLGTSAFFLSNTLGLQGRFNTTTQTDTKVTLTESAYVTCMSTALVDLRSAIKDFESGLEDLDESFSTGVTFTGAEMMGAKTDWQENYYAVEESLDEAEDAYDELTAAHDAVSAAYTALKSCK